MFVTLQENTKSLKKTSGNVYERFRENITDILENFIYVSEKFMGKFLKKVWKTLRMFLKPIL